MRVWRGCGERGFMKWAANVDLLVRSSLRFVSFSPPTLPPLHSPRTHQVVQLVVPVQVDLVRAAADLGALLQLLVDAGPAGSRQEGHKPVGVRDDAVEDLTRREHARPADEAGHPVRALPVGVLLAAEGGGARVGPGVGVGACGGVEREEGGEDRAAGGRASSVRWWARIHLIHPPLFSLPPTFCPLALYSLSLPLSHRCPSST